MTSTRITPEELRARREFLGLTGEALADALGVRHDTVRAWESGKDPVPHRVPAEVAAIEEDTRQVVARVVADARAGDQGAFYRHCEGGALKISEAQHARGDRWWSQVFVRAKEALGPRWYAASTYSGLDDPGDRIASSFYQWDPCAAAEEVSGHRADWYGYLTPDGQPADITEPGVGRATRALIRVHPRGADSYDRVVWVRREW